MLNTSMALPRGSLFVIYKKNYRSMPSVIFVFFFCKKSINFVLIKYPKFMLTVGTAAL